LEKYGRDNSATYDNIMWRICCASWVTKATDTYSEQQYAPLWGVILVCSFPILCSV